MTLHRRSGRVTHQTPRRSSSASLSHPLFILASFASLFFSRPSVVGALSFFISFPTSLCAASSPSTSSSTKIALFQRVPPLWGLAAVFESPIIRGRPSIPIESRHIDPRHGPRTAENKEELSLSTSPSLSCIATDYWHALFQRLARIVLTKDKQRLKNDIALLEVAMRRFDQAFFFKLNITFPGFKIRIILTNLIFDILRTLYLHYSGSFFRQIWIIRWNWNRLLKDNFTELPPSKLKSRCKAMKVFYKWSCNIEYLSTCAIREQHWCH